MEANTISYIALSISAVTAISGFFVFLRYDRRLKKQARELNEKLEIIYDSQIRKIEQEKTIQDTATFLVKSLPYNGLGKHTIRISNIGKGKATNIRLGKNTFTNSNGIASCNFQTINGLEPKGNADFALITLSGVKQNFTMTLIWNDKKNEDNSKDFSINL
ncbi:hypothetical protein [Labilibaculum euxinus]